jgi:hypothetical protein
VASALILIVFYGLVAIIFALWRHHEVSLLKTELQEQTILTFSRITHELAETASATVGTGTDGLVFASPRDENGSVIQDSDGRLKWQKFVAFYIETVDGVPTIFRKEKLIPNAERVSDPPSPIGAYSLASIRGESLEVKQIARNVAQLDCQRSGELVAVQVVVKKFYPRQNRDYTMLTKFGFTVRN